MLSLTRNAVKISQLPNYAKIRYDNLVNCKSKCKSIYRMSGWSYNWPKHRVWKVENRFAISCSTTSTTTSSRGWYSGYATTSITNYTNSTNSDRRKYDQNHEKKFHKYAQNMFIYGIGFWFFKKKEEEEDEMITLLKNARISEMGLNFDKASQFYHDALAMLQDRERNGTWPENEILDGKIYIYDGMANVALALNNLDEAERLFKETIKGLFQAGKLSEDNSIIEISLKLATIYALQGNTAACYAGFQYCMSILEKKLCTVNKAEIREKDPEDESGHLNTLALLGMCTTAFSRFLITQNKYEQASKTLTNAIKIAKQVFGEENNQVAVLYSDLATVKAHLKDLDGAKKDGLLAINIGKKCKSEDLAMFYCNLCYLCMDRKELIEADQAGRKSARMASDRGDKFIENKARECVKQVRSNKDWKRFGFF